jgi:hypothetical protein
MNKSKTRGKKTICTIACRESDTTIQRNDDEMNESCGARQTESADKELIIIKTRKRRS